MQHGANSRYSPISSSMPPHASLRCQDCSSRTDVQSTHEQQYKLSTTTPVVVICVGDACASSCQAASTEGMPQHGPASCLHHMAVPRSRPRCHNPAAAMQSAQPARVKQLQESIKLSPAMLQLLAMFDKVRAPAALCACRMQAVRTCYTQPELLTAVMCNDRGFATATHAWKRVCASIHVGCHI